MGCVGGVEGNYFRFRFRLPFVCLFGYHENVTRMGWCSSLDLSVILGWSCARPAIPPDKDTIAIVNYRSSSSSSLAGLHSYS